MHKDSFAGKIPSKLLVTVKGLQDACKQAAQDKADTMKRDFAPRIDATPEEMAKAMFSLPAGHQWEYEKDGGKVYKCADCGGE